MSNVLKTTILMALAVCVGLFVLLSAVGFIFEVIVLFLALVSFAWPLVAIVAGIGAIVWIIKGGNSTHHTP